MEYVKYLFQGGDHSVKTRDLLGQTNLNYLCSGRRANSRTFARGKKRCRGKIVGKNHHLPSSHPNNDLDDGCFNSSRKGSYQKCSCQF